MVIRAGKLRQRVSIQTRTTAANTYNEPVETWTTTATVWGELTPLLTGTREAMALGSDILQARVSWQCRLRYTDLSPVTNRLLIDGRLFEVTGVTDPDGRKAELVAFCYEVQD